MNRAEDLAARREAFYSLSQQMAMTLQTFPLDQIVYQAYCPMAFNNAGATWLQAEKEITNPYFGDMMLRCGEIRDSLGESAKPQIQCPVMSGAINKEFFTDYNGMRIYFCCPGCDAAFKEDPEKYIEQMRAEGIQPEKLEEE